MAIDLSTRSDSDTSGHEPSTPAARPEPRPRWSARLQHWIGVDRAIAYTVAARSWAALAGIVSVLLIARFLTPTEQGYYYTYSSLVALQIVFELGFSFVILQLAAHECATLTLKPGAAFEGNPVAVARLASVLRNAVKWYSVAGVVMTATVLPAGFYFFARHDRTNVPWQGPWILLVLASTAAFLIDPVFSFLEGCGLIAEVARRRFVQAMLGSCLSWTALIAHKGLYSPALVIVGQVLVGAGFLITPQLRGLLLGLLRHDVSHHRVHWRTEIWPFQWRIALSWICGYFIFSLFNPVLFAYQGPVVAGQMGMSLGIATSIGAVTLAWINTKASPFGSLIARNDYKSLDKLFFRALWQSTTLLIASSLAFLLVLAVAQSRFPRFAHRVLAPGPFALLLATTIAMHIVISQAIYLRAHKKEPFLLQSMFIALLIGASTLLLGKNTGINGVVVGYFIFGGLVNAATGTYIFVTKRRAWHSSLPREVAG